jgi:hypothetical protein
MKDLRFVGAGNRHDQNLVYGVYHKPRLRPMRKSIPEWSEVIPRTPDRAIIDGMVRRLYTAGV